MARHTTFRYCLDPMVEQSEVLSRHAGAARFAFNQSLRLVKTALGEKSTDPRVRVPWTGFDLINAFNSWKKTEPAGRVFTVTSTGQAEVVVTGLAWRGEVCQQVFEEAAVDLGKALTAWMLTNHRLARAISDVAWSEFARILAHKQIWRGGQTTSVDRWYPSSKTCSSCGTVKTTMILAERTFACDTCGHSLVGTQTQTRRRGLNTQRGPRRGRAEPLPRFNTFSVPHTAQPSGCAADEMDQEGQ